MTTDYFDKVCQWGATHIELKQVGVDELWQKRMELAAKHKKERIREFYRSFSEVMQNVHNGHEYTLEEIRNTRYWKYLQGYHPSWREEPLSSKADKQLRYKFRSGIRLYEDIKANGMKNPLAIIVNGGECLYRGLRRLVILKILGVKIAEVQYAIVGGRSRS